MIRGILALFIAFALPCAAAGSGRAQDPSAAPGAQLRARYLALQDQLRDNQYRRPLYMESSEGRREVTGEIYALINSPFASTGAAFSVPRDWCDILLLHLNTKGCRVTSLNHEPGLSLWIGRNQPQALADAHRVDFAYQVEARSERFLQVSLVAGTGPMGTRDYRISLAAIPVEDGKTFIHFRYSYGFDSFGRFAMQTYLATIGRNKVGFTVVGARPDGQSQYIRGLRGVVERNTMRYYAAIEAFFGAQSGSPQVRFEKRIRDWFAAIEHYPRQLHELGREEYLDMKRMESLRQQAGPA